MAIVFLFGVRGPVRNVTATARLDRQIIRWGG